MKYRILALSILLTGCAAPVTMQAVGGSRSDGTVTLAYQYGLFQRPIVDPGQAYNTAKDFCAGWGYSNAQPFGGDVSQCEQYNGNGTCLLTRVSVTYQCTGSPS